MEPARILWYVEPAMFRDNPLLTRAWSGWVTRIIRAARAAGHRHQFGVAGNGPTVRAIEERLLHPLEFSLAATQRDVLGSMAFDRFAYAGDLFDPDDSPVVNQGMARWLEQAKQNFAPDLVISFSQNRYLEKVFPDTRKLYAEFAPYGRTATQQALFMDPCGHQTGNMLVRHWSSIVGGPLLPGQHEALKQLWMEAIEGPAREHASFDTLSNWLREQAKGHKVALLATQPPDWITYEGALSTTPLSGLVMRWLDALPPDWMGCATFHPHYRLPADACTLIQKEFPNALFLPEDAPRGASELLLPLADAVVTISSSIGVQAALWGKPVSTQGRSSLSALGAHSIGDLDHAQGLNEEQRLCLWRFLTGRYSHPLESLINDGDYFTDFIKNWDAAGGGHAYFLDGSAWDEPRARKMLFGELPADAAAKPEPAVPMTASAKRLLLFNETNVLHHIGCQGVSDGHRHIAERAGATDIETIDCFEIRRFFTPLLQKIPFRDEPSWYEEAAAFLARRPALREPMARASVIAVNGEGSIHHGAGMPYLALLLAAKQIGKRAALVNALLEALPDSAGHVLSQLDVLTVREPLSQREAQRVGAHAAVEPDAIVEARFTGEPERDFKGRAVLSDAHWDGGIDIVEALRARPRSPMESWRMDQFIDWRTAVASLRTASVFITARHHGVYLAMLAGIPFVPLPANTRKIHGTLEMLQYPEDVCTTPQEVMLQWTRAMDDPERLTNTYEKVLGRVPLESFSRLFG